MTVLDPDSVVDRASFFLFVESLIADRLSAEEQERGNPHRYSLGGAEGWQNSTISSYLECALAGTGDQADWGKSSAGPTWRDLAVFLWLGKIYE